MEKSGLLFATDDNDSRLNINDDSPEWKTKALLYTQNYFKKSYRFASDIQENIGRADLDVQQRQKGIWVLRTTQIPSVLIWTGFISIYGE